MNHKPCAVVMKLTGEKNRIQEIVNSLRNDFRILESSPFIQNTEDTQFHVFVVVEQREIFKAFRSE